tara:strand:+ start:1376 stop:2029 length:654 start_codon:yes stop_codon:yes gene_type:complete
MVKRRISGEPFQLILGKASFYGRDYFINRNVLIPRPESEIIIDLLKKFKSSESILEIGTGTGCLAITCELENISNNITATDISPNALKIAYKNADYFNIENIQFSLHNILTDSFDKKFRVVISNPPYISKNEMQQLSSEILNYEPHIALLGGNDGLLFYHRFAQIFNELVSDGGYMLLEIGGDHQKISIQNIFLNYNLSIKFYKDLQNNNRVVKIYK